MKKKTMLVLLNGTQFKCKSSDDQEAQDNITLEEFAEAFRKYVSRLDDLQVKLVGGEILVMGKAAIEHAGFVFMEEEVEEEVADGSSE